jgi:hypothetical protein
VFTWMEGITSEWRPLPAMRRRSARLDMAACALGSTQTQVVSGGPTSD